MNSVSSYEANQLSTMRNLRTANAHLQAENTELRGQVSTERARRRTAIRALTAGDTDAALRALTEEATE